MPIHCTDQIDLKTLLMHGTLQEGAGQAATTFHEVLLDASGKQQASFQGSANLHGTKMILHNSLADYTSGKVQFESAVRWGPDLKASVEILGLAPGSDILFAMKSSREDAEWNLTAPALANSMLDKPTEIPALSGLGFAIHMAMLDIDRPVADVSVWANIGAGWMQRVGCRATVPEPFLLEVTQQNGDLLLTFSDVFMRKVKCPALRLPRLARELADSTGCPNPALFPVLAASSVSPPQHSPQGTPQDQAAGGKGVVETPGDAKPFLCPDGKRFTTRRNAERWLQKHPAGLEAQLQAPSQDDANAVMQHMAAAESAAQALDAAQAASSRPSVVVSCPQLTISSTHTSSVVACVEQLLPLAARVLAAHGGLLANSQHGALVAAACKPQGAAAAAGALSVVIQIITGGTADTWEELWVHLEQPGLWSSSAVPGDVTFLQGLLSSLCSGAVLHLDLSTVNGHELWRASESTL